MNFQAFYSPAFIEIICDVYKLRTLKPFDPKSPASQTPIFISKKLFKSGFAFSLPFGFYQTADCINKSIDIDSWNELCDYSNKNELNISITSVGSPNFCHGVHVANNPIMEIDHLKEPFDFYSKNHKQNIRKERNKAKSYDVTVCFTDSEGDLTQFYDVMSNQYIKDHRMVFQPFALFSKLHSSGMGKLLVAKHDGEVIGGLFCISDGEVFHYNWGVRKRFLNVNVGTLLIDHAISYSFSMGYRYFNFGSTPLSDFQLYDFKMKWGSENYPIYKCFTQKNIPQIDLNSSYKYARLAYSKIPSVFARKMMPFVVPWLVN